MTIIDTPVLLISQSETLPATLQQARKAKRLSQLELSLRMGVSQRHISFVESGRAKASRELLLAWLQELEAPLALRNAVLLQAGFAPAYSDRTLNDPALQQANNALAQLLSSHDPMPAMVIDSFWNVLHMNRGAQWLATTLAPQLANLQPGTPLNMLDWLADPEGLTKHMINVGEVLTTMLAHMHDSVTAHPSLAPKVDAIAAMIRQRVGAQPSKAEWIRSAAPVLTTRFTTPFGELAFFSMFTTFGTPHDITLASLRVEHMFAADESTKRVLEEQVGRTVKVSEPAAVYGFRPFPKNGSVVTNELINQLKEQEGR